MVYKVIRQTIQYTAMDSTSIEAMFKGSGIYQMDKKNNRTKIHIAARTKHYTLPLKAIITPANVRNSKVFEDIL